MSYLHLLRQDCPVPRGTPCVAYARDSGHEEQSRSVAQQVAAISEYVDAHGLVLVQPAYTDEARIGSSTDKRNQLAAMRAFVAAEHPHVNDKFKREKKAESEPFAVLFFTSARLGRDDIETDLIRLELRKRAITVIDLTAASTGVPLADRILELIKARHDEMWLEEMSTGIKRGLAQLVSLRDTDPEFLRHNPTWPDPRLEHGKREVLHTEGIPYPLSPARYRRRGHRFPRAR